MKQKEFNKLLQKAMNEAGTSPKFSLTGTYGPQTEKETDKYDFTIVAVPKKVMDLPTRPSPAGGYFGAPWMGLDMDLLGRHESDPELNKRYVPEWKNVGLPGYKTLVGNRHAWCSIRCTAVLRRSNIPVKGLTAGAASHSKWGKRSPFWFGCTLDIKHKGGGRHVCFFLYWIDEKKKIAATLDGNRGNRFCVARTDLSGAGDTLVTGPRWSNDWPDGQLVSMGEVLKVYPHLKVGGSGSSGTR